MWTALIVLEAVWLAGISVYILLERRSPVATLAWLFAFAAAPGIGLVVYVFVGKRRLLRRRARYARTKESVPPDETGPGVEAERRRLEGGAAAVATLVERAAGAPVKRATDVRIYLEGAALYDDLEEAIRAARHHVHLEYYIWTPDRTGTRLRDALIERAREGVEVRFLVDGFGSKKLRPRFLRPLEEAGARVAWFNRSSWTRFRPRLMNFRTHRKIVVCDGTVGFTGGMNVVDDHTAAVVGEAAWRDTHVRLEGDAARGLQRVFLENWHFSTEEAPGEDVYPPSGGSEGAHLAQIVHSGPVGEPYAIHKALYQAIAGANRRVLATTPYFVPDEPILTAFAVAAWRGVDVRLLVPRKGDSLLVRAAARTYYPELLEAGVRIFEYGPPMLHAKTLVVDDDVTVVGTANLDNRSFRLNFEVAAVLYGREHAARLARVFAEDEERAVQVRTEDLEKAGVPRRLFESFARLLSPLL
jgi:cardiolipin synthase